MIYFKVLLNSFEISHHPSLPKLGFNQAWVIEKSYGSFANDYHYLMGNSPLDFKIFLKINGNGPYDEG